MIHIPTTPRPVSPGGQQERGRSPPLFFERRLGCPLSVQTVTRPDPLAPSTHSPGPTPRREKTLRRSFEGDPYVAEPDPHLRPHGPTLAGLEGENDPTYTHVDFDNPVGSKSARIGLRSARTLGIYLPSGPRA